MEAIDSSGNGLADDPAAWGGMRSWTRPPAARGAHSSTGFPHRQARGPVLGKGAVQRTSSTIVDNHEDLFDELAFKA